MLTVTLSLVISTNSIMILWASLSNSEKVIISVRDVEYRLFTLQDLFNYIFVFWIKDDPVFNQIIKKSKWKHQQITIE